MDLKCLIKLLIEKEYIKEYNKIKTDDFGVIAVQYECKYSEVRSKIFETITKEKEMGGLLEIEPELRTVRGKEHITIINIIKLEDYILSLSENRENFRINKNRLNDMEIFSDTFDMLENIEVERDIRSFYITNNIVKKARIKRKEEEKKECLDFLSKLP